MKDIKITHKISSLFARIYSKPKNKFILSTKLPFCSLISVTEKKKEFYKFENYWIKKKDVVPINYKTADFQKYYNF